MKKILSLMTIAAMLLSMAGCAEETTSEPVATTTALIDVQGDHQTTASTTTSAPAESKDAETTEAIPDTPDISPVKDNKYNLDGVYNTTFENNISDDVYFDVRIEYTDDSGNVVSEIISLADDLSYDDVANKLNSFGLLTTGETRDWSITKTSESRDTDGKLIYADGEHEFEYYGIAHNISIAPDAKTSVYLELVDESGLITDTAAITAKSSVKAIGSFMNKDDYNEYVLGYRDYYDNEIPHCPVKVVVRAHLTEEATKHLSEDEAYMLTTENLYEMQIGTDLYNVKKVFFKDLSDIKGKYIAIKNTAYTLVLFTQETNGYVGDIILIKN